MRFNPEDETVGGPRCRNCHRGSSGCGGCHNTNGGNNPSEMLTAWDDSDAKDKAAENNRTDIMQFFAMVNFNAPYGMTGLIDGVPGIDLTGDGANDIAFDNGYPDWMGNPYGPWPTLNRSQMTDPTSPLWTLSEATSPYKAYTMYNLLNTSDG